jgi:hypothetical protein
MAYEERQVVTDDPAVTPVAEPVTPVVQERVVREPAAVVEQVPSRRVVYNDDPVSNAFAASQLIQTIVWSVVVIVLLIVALWALHVYAGLF